MFKFRAISFPILLGIFLLTIFWKDGGPWIFWALSGLMMFALTLEVLQMLEKAGVPSFPKVTGILTALFFWAVILGNEWPAGKAVIFCLFFLLLFGSWLALLRVSDRILFLKKFLVSCGTFLFIAVPYLLLVVIYYSKDVFLTVDGTIEEIRTGSMNFLFLVLVTKAMDTGGYIAGVLSGKWMPGGNHKIIPSISPKKSVEGTLGGILFSVGTALIFYACGAAPVQTGIGWCLLAGLILAVGSFAGDLTESALKRACGVKDSAHWIPGMGGVFDVLDSFIYNGILFSILLMIKF